MFIHDKFSISLIEKSIIEAPSVDTPRALPHLLGLVTRAICELVGPMRLRQACTAPSLPSTSAHSGPPLMKEDRAGKKGRPWCSA